MFICLFKALIVEEPASEPREPHPANLVSLRTAAAALRDQIHRIEKEEEVKGTLNNRRTSGGSGSSSNLPGSTAGGQNPTANLKATEKPRKKLAEVEAQLVLASPSLVFQVSITVFRVLLRLYFYFESEFVTLIRFDKLKITLFTNTRNWLKWKRN